MKSRAQLRGALGGHFGVKMKEEAEKYVEKKDDLKELPEKAKKKKRKKGKLLEYIEGKK